ncbi:MAG TPA: hypothetical protein VLD67_14685 [Vicinamibacterales bacterium]|nr:hypothetical protein [Vicinamibacterales bacterium]
MQGSGGKRGRARLSICVLVCCALATAAGVLHLTAADVIAAAGALTERQIAAPSPSDAPLQSEAAAASRMLVFLIVTIGHFALTAAWLWLFERSDLSSAEEFIFFAGVFGIGSLLAVLHALASTIGISLGAGASVMAGAHGLALLLWRRSTRRIQPSSPTPPARDVRPLRVGWLALPGAVVMLALSLQWLDVTSVSLRVTGTDAAHYHVPHAINYAHGATLFGHVATPHLYPMAGSIWAAWLLQPLDGPMLLDLMTFPAAVLLLVSLAWLFRRAVGEEGIVWAPWLFLLLLSAPLVRVSLLPSADMFHAAAFVALFAQAFAVWRTGEIRSVDLLGLALCTGMLLGSKTTGVFSAIAILGAFGLLTLAGRPGGVRRAPAWRATTWALAASIAAVLLAGGVWLIRNWILFDSPLAPSGLTIAGFGIFPGDAYLEGGYYNSVLKDIRDLKDYDPAARFATYARRLMGPWFLPAVLCLLFFAADAAADWYQRSRPGPVTMARGAFLLALLILILAHAAILIPAPWTSLEWTRGLALRYALPLLVLYVTGMVLCLFPAGLSEWQRFPATRWIVGTVSMSLVTAHYIRRSAIPNLPVDEWFPVLRTDLVLLACGAAGLVLACRRWRRAGVLACASFAIAAAVLFSQRVASANSRLQAQAGAALSRRVERLAGGGADRPNEHRCVYLRALAFERGRPQTTGRRRFFVASRFDQPLDLQGPALENLVYDTRGRTERPALLRADGPGRGPRDYLVIDRAEQEDGRSVRLAFRVAQEAGMQYVGACGRYQVYYAGRGGQNQF